MNGLFGVSPGGRHLPGHLRRAESLQIVLPENLATPRLQLPQNRVDQDRAMNPGDDVVTSIRDPGMESLNVSLLPPVMAAGVTDRTDQPRLGVLYEVTRSHVPDEDLMNQGLGILGRHLEFPDGDFSQHRRVLAVEEADGGSRSLLERPRERQADRTCLIWNWSAHATPK